MTKESLPSPRLPTQPNHIPSSDVTSLTTDKHTGLAPHGAHAPLHCFVLLQRSHFYPCMPPLPFPLSAAVKPRLHTMLGKLLVLIQTLLSPSPSSLTLHTPTKSAPVSSLKSPPPQIIISFLTFQKHSCMHTHTRSEKMPVCSQNRFPFVF